MTEERTKEKEILWHRLNELFVKAFATYHLLNDDDHVLVGISGGKDSLCLLELLAQRAKIHHPRFQVEALHVRMENIHYETSTNYLTQFCQELEIPLHIRTTRFEIGGDSCRSSKDARRQKSPCFLCSWYRRKMLFNTAQELGCNKIALGHHQDDILNTALMNLTFQGRFGTMPALLKMKKMPIIVIRPLCMIPEELIRQYAELRTYEQQKTICPYEHESHRTDIRQLYDLAERQNPEFRHSLWNALNSEGKLVEEY